MTGSELRANDNAAATLTWNGYELWLRNGQMAGWIGRDFTGDIYSVPDAGHHAFLISRAENRLKQVIDRVTEEHAREALELAAVQEYGDG